MKQLRRGWKRLTGAIAGSRYERELADEIETHLRLQTEDNLKLGMSPQDARRAAVLKFGGIESVKERYRDQRGLPLLETFGQDVRYALRMMRRNRGFTVAAMTALALGIGVTTAIFSVADSILLRPLPYPRPESLASISLGGAMTAPMFETFRQQARSIEGAALFVNESFDVSGQGEPERLPGARVSAGLFNVLGIQPQLGRAFTTDEDGRDDLVLIGDGLWRRRFAADPRVLGRTLILNGAPRTIIGVMPPGFQFPDGPELPYWAGVYPPAQMWRPMALAEWERTCTGCFNFAMIARLRPGIPLEQGRLELDGIWERSLGRTPRAGSDHLAIRTLHEAVTNNVRTPILILLGAVTLALLIACVNVASLLLARGLRRQEEIALRLSLGATGGRVVRQLLTEAFALAFSGACLAVPIGWAAIRVLIAIAPDGIPRIETIGLDARMLAFAFGLALLSALLFGTAPAVLTARRAPAEGMKLGGRTTTAAPSRLREALVIAEFALSLLLLVGSSLLAKSFVTVSRISLGFRPENVLTMRLSLPDTRYDGRRRAALIERLISNCSALPGATTVAATSMLPLAGQGEGWGLIAEDNPNRDDYVMARVRAVTPAYFRTLGIRLRAGRAFNENDRGTNPVAIVSDSAARRLWPGVPVPLGRRLTDRHLTVVGIVDDTHASGVDAEVRPYLYVPFWQFAQPDFAVAVRSVLDPASLANAVKAEIWRLDKDQPVTHVALMKQLVADSIAPRRFYAVLMTLFAGFALVLTAIGVFGVLSYSVAQRTQEIGIRIALGASRWRVVAGVLNQACILAIAGTAIGLVAAFRVTPLLRNLLYGVGVTEPSIFLGCAVLLVGVAVVASIIPALRAAKLDPTTCLRCE